MIIRAQGAHLHAITQPDHAQLSRRIMERSAALRAHPRRASILLAVGEHDNGWTEPDAAPSVNPGTGRPFDFVTAPLEMRHGVWTRGVARLADDPWAAALVANHAITVYDHYRGQAEWTSFFTRMEALRGDILRAAGGGLEDLLADYTWVRLGDLLSLVFCTGWTEEQRFVEWTVRRERSNVLVTPDLFEGEVVPLQVTARVLPDRRYEDDADLREALAVSDVIRLSGELRNSSRASS